MTHKTVGSPLTRLIATIAPVLVTFLSVASVSAAEPIQLVIKPAETEDNYFSLTMAPGERRELVVQLGNGGTEPTRARTFAADAYTLVNGGYGTRLDTEPTSAVTGWIAYAPDTLTLAPKASIDRTFSVTVPADTKPGEYLASLVLQTADPLPIGGGQGGVAVNQITRKAIAVSITVPGPRAPGLAIGEASHKAVAGDSVVMVGLSNTGNVRLKPSGEFILRDDSGKEISRAPVKMDSFYAVTDTSIEVPLAQRLNPGRYVGSLTLVDESGVKASDEQLPFTVAAPDLMVESEAARDTAAAVNQVGPSGATEPSLALLLIGAAGGGAAVVALGLGGVFLWRRKRRTVA